MPKLNLFGSFQAQLAAVMVALAVLGAGLPGGYFVWRSYAALRQQAQAGQQALADTLARSADRSAGHALETLEALSSRREVRGLDGPATARALGLAMQANQSFDGLALIAPDGRCLALAWDPAGKPALPPRAELRLLYQAAERSGEAVLSDCYTVGEELSVAMALPVLRHGRPVALMLGSLPLANLGLSIDEIRLGQNGYALLVDENGSALLRPGFAPRAANPRAYADLVKRQGGVAEFRGADGRGVLAAYSRIESVNWGVVVRQSSDECYAPARKMVRLLSLYLAAFVVATALLSLLLARLVSAPLARLADAAGSQGDVGGLDPAAFEAQQGPTEIAKLGQALAGMAGRLRDQERAREQAHSRALKAEKRLAEAERLASLGQLAAGLAHELNNPLAVILGSAQEAAAAKTPKAAAPWIDRIAREAARTQRLVHDLLDYARPMKLIRSRQSLDGLARQAWQQALQGRQHLYTLEAPQPLPPARVDPDRLLQVFINLFSNAFEAMPQGGKVTVAAEQADGHVRLWVGDNGPGFPKAKASALFRPFYTTKPHGTGLGLAICQRILKAHGGDIHAQAADKGKGALFILELPQ